MSTEEAINESSVGSAISTTRIVMLPAEVWETIMLYVQVKDMPSASRISRQHYKIAHSTTFCARYLLKHHRACEAIYEASCRPELFNSALLETLLSMGAIMSRHFVQCFIMTYLHRQKSWSSDSNWLRHISVQAFTSVLNEAYKLYDERLELSAKPQDYNVFERWASRSHIHFLQEEVKEVLVIGKFAPLADHQQYSRGQEIVSLAIAKCPHVMDLLEKNGYTIKDSDLSLSLSNLFERSDEEEAKLYEQVQAILAARPDWQPSASTCMTKWMDAHLRDMITMATDQREKQLLLENEGLGPVHPAFKVIMKIHSEGRCFQDLEQYVLKSVKAILANKYTRVRYTGGIRMLHRYFPRVLQEEKYEIGATFLQSWSDIHKTLVRYVPGQEILLDCTLTTLAEMSLDPIQLGRLFAEDEEYSASLLTAAYKYGLFGQDWISNFDKVIRTVIGRYMEDPLAGRFLKILASQVSKCRILKNQKEVHRLQQGSFTHQLRMVLYEWMFDLDRIMPDNVSSDSVDTRLRTPLGWMVKGAIKTEPQFGCYHHKKAVDPYLLLPLSTQKTLTFTLINKTSSRTLSEAIQEVNSMPVTMATLQYDNVKEVEPMCMCGSRRFKTKETTHALIEILGQDDDAIRDVLLSHALANGNMELSHKLMAVDNSTDIGSGKNATAMPTLSHLMVLQKLGRRPLELFLDCILRGAPFKQGYVKSSLLPKRKFNAACTSESASSSQDTWRDDGPMLYLYAEKDRLQKLDQDVQHEIPSNEKGITDDACLKIAGTMDSSHWDQSVLSEFDLYLQESILEPDSIVTFECCQRQYRLDLKSLVRQKRSIVLWLDHLELLLWFEDRKIEMGKEDSTIRIGLTNPFYIGLSEMIKEVKILTGVFDLHLMQQAKIHNVSQSKMGLMVAQIDKTERESAKGSIKKRKRGVDGSVKKFDSSYHQSSDEDIRKKVKKEDEMEEMIISYLNDSTKKAIRCVQIHAMMAQYG